MLNLNFENADVFYDETYLDKSTSEKLFLEISQMFIGVENKIVQNEMSNTSYKLNRKTMVFIDLSIDKSLIPKIWGKDVDIHEFPESLAAIKSNLEKKFDFKFNICLANYYDNGKSNIGWHSDNEEKGSISCIASLSLGAERNFVFRKKGSSEICKDLLLQNGSLIVMAKGCQENYQHSLPVDKSCNDTRLNLTFRLFDNDRYVNH
jgi:alkylated DNA repair dioxygenase AlkB